MVIGMWSSSMLRSTAEFGREVSIRRQTKDDEHSYDLSKISSATSMYASKMCVCEFGDFISSNSETVHPKKTNTKTIIRKRANKRTKHEITKNQTKPNITYRKRRGDAGYGG